MVNVFVFVSAELDDAVGLGCGDIYIYGVWVVVAFCLCVICVNLGRTWKRGLERLGCWARSSSRCVALDLIFIRITNDNAE